MLFNSCWKYFFWFSSFFWGGWVIFVVHAEISVRWLLGHSFESHPSLNSFLSVILPDYLQRSFGLFIIPMHMKTKTFALSEINQLSFVVGCKLQQIGLLHITGIVSIFWEFKIVWLVIIQTCLTPLIVQPT